MEVIIALDIHRDFSRALVVTEELEILRDERINHNTPDGLSQLFMRMDADSAVVMEATFNWPWVAELAVSKGLVPHLADCKTARRRSGKSKSDKKDALWLARLWFSKELFPHCYRPTNAQIDIRDRYRHRKLLVNMRTRMKNSIHGFLYRNGVNLSSKVSDLFSTKGRAMLQQVELEGNKSEILTAKLSALDAVVQQIDELDHWLKSYVHGDHQCRLLMSIPGIAELTAFGIMSEIGQIERFPCARALASYAGVLPRVNESADKDLGRHTGGDCNKHLRHLAIETVTGAIRSSSRFRSLHARISSRNRRAGAKARVAVARAVMESVWFVLSRDQSYQERPEPRRRMYRVSPVSLSA